MHDTISTAAPARAPVANAAPNGGVLAAQGVGQRFRSADGTPLWALQDITLNVSGGEFVSLIGPSGAGKSTLLNILAGLDAPATGSVWLNGQHTTPRERLGQIGLMPQRDLLLPWRTALDNASAGLMVHGVPKREAQAQARELFARFGLAAFAHTYPYALSGGMRQRVALIRSALAAGSVLLLDEPFGALDALTRSELHHWLVEAWQTLGKTIILVTHDINEALILSDRIVVLTAHPGRVKSEIAVDLPRPRDAAVQASVAFGALHQQLMDALEVRS